MNVIINLGFNGEDNYTESGIDSNFLTQTTFVVCFHDFKKRQI